MSQLPTSPPKRQRDTKRVMRQSHLERDSRQEALEKVRSDQAGMDARIRGEERAFAAAQTAVTQAATTRDAPGEREVATLLRQCRTVEIAERALAIEAGRAARRKLWPQGSARYMYRQGYSLKHCMAATGWDADVFKGALEVQRILDAS